MAFDGITLNCIMNELQELIGGRIDGVYQHSKSSFTLEIYNGQKCFLAVDVSANNYRVNLTTIKRRSLPEAPNFCMLLRKYLISSRIKRIYTKGLERILYIEVSAINELNDTVARTLVVELMGKYSNIILTNQDNKILDALNRHESDTSMRDIIPSRIYYEPANSKSDLLDISTQEFYSLLNNSNFKTLEQAVSNSFIGVSKLFIQSCIEKLKISNNINKKSAELIYNYILNIIKNPNNATCERFKNDYIISYNVDQSANKNTTADYNKDDNQIEENNQNKNRNENEDSNPNNKVQRHPINEFLDNYYQEKEEREGFAQYRNMLLKILNGTLNKLLKQMENINFKIAACDEMPKFKKYGELLLANIYNLQNLKYTDIVEVDDYTENMREESVKIKIPIDSKLSISQNAERYFKKYTKLKNTLEIVNKQKADTEYELNYIKKLVDEIEQATTKPQLDKAYEEISENILFADIKMDRRKEKRQKTTSALTNYIKIKIDGYDVLVGKNNKQNDYITLKVANDNDMWFHTKEIQGSHLILRCGGEMPKISTIEKCAQIAAYHSKAKYSSHVPVDYCFRKYVKKPNGAAAGFVIYEKNKTIYVNPKIEELNS